MLDEFDSYSSEKQTNQLTFEKAKIHLMQTVLQQLEKEARVPRTSANNFEETPDASYSSWRWAAFILLMAVEFVPMFLGNLMFAGSSMASLAPYLFFISPPVMTAIGVMCALSMLGGAICFIGPILMKWLGINKANPSPSVLSAYEQQLEIAERLDNCLLKHNDISCRNYQLYANFSKKISDTLKAIQLQKKGKKLLASITTWLMTALAGIQALSGSILLAATIMGVAIGAFTMATSSPVILSAFVAHHMWGVFFAASPIAICQLLVSYVLRVCSTSNLLDAGAEERDRVANKRDIYITERPNVESQLNKVCFEKSRQDYLADMHGILLSRKNRRPFLDEIKPGIHSRLKKSSHQPTSNYLKEQERRALYIRRHR